MLCFQIKSKSIFKFLSSHESSFPPPDILILELAISKDACELLLGIGHDLLGNLFVESALNVNVGAGSISKVAAEGLN